MKSILLLCLFVTSTAWASDPYFEVSSVEHYGFEQESQLPVLLSKKINFAPVEKPLVLRDVSIEDIINIGEWLWQIVEENKPTVDFKGKTATAIPEKAGHPNKMEHWEAPSALTYLLIFKNGFGSEVVRFKYKVIYSPKGSYEGKGQYLANASIHPVEIDVSWGFDFNAQVVIEDVLNLGSQEDPHAGMQMAMQWNVESWTKYIEGQEIYFIQGNGESKQL